jgi:hypothetical protein
MNLKELFSLGSFIVVLIASIEIIFIVFNPDYFERIMKDMNDSKYCECRKYRFLDGHFSFL